MRKKLNFSDCEYPNKDFRPKLYFYRFLAPLPDFINFPRHSRLEMWIPNTIVCDGNSSPFWIYSKNGFVYRVDNFTQSQIYSRFGSPNRNELSAVSKTVILTKIIAKIY